MEIKILNSKEKHKIAEKLKERFGIASIPYIIVQSGKERLRIASINLSIDELEKLSKNANIELIGLYFATLVNEEIRLSMDATHLLKSQINKNILEISESEKDEWLKGRDLQRENAERGFVVIKYGDDLLGTGKLSQDKISNFIPKERRIKENR